MLPPVFSTVYLTLQSCRGGSELCAFSNWHARCSSGEQSGGRKKGLGSWCSLTQPCKARQPWLPTYLVIKTETVWFTAAWSSPRRVSDNFLCPGRYQRDSLWDKVEGWKSDYYHGDFCECKTYDSSCGCNCFVASWGPERELGIWFIWFRLPRKPVDTWGEFLKWTLPCVLSSLFIQQANLNLCDFVIFPFTSCMLTAIGSLLHK